MNQQPHVLTRLLRFSVVVTVFAAATATIGSAAGDSVVADVTHANDVVQLATFKYDAKTLDKILTNDFVLVLSLGRVMDRKAFLADIVDKSATWVQNKTESISIHPFNGDCAIAIGVLRLQYKEKNKLQDRRIRFTDVWVKQDGQWKWASSSVEHLDKPKG